MATISLDIKRLFTGWSNIGRARDLAICGFRVFPSMHFEQLAVVAVDSWVRCLDVDHIAYRLKNSISILVIDVFNIVCRLF